jgi:hypothetical protein
VLDDLGLVLPRPVRSGKKTQPATTKAGAVANDHHPTVSVQVQQVQDASKKGHPMSNTNVFRVEIMGESLAHLDKSAQLMGVTREQTLVEALHLIGLFAKENRNGRLLVTMEPDGSKMMRYRLKGESKQ